MDALVTALYATAAFSFVAGVVLGVVIRGWPK